MTSKEFLERILKAKFPDYTEWSEELVASLLDHEELLDRAERVILEQTHIVSTVKTAILLQQIREAHLPLNNAKAGQAYFYEFELEEFPLDRIRVTDITGLEELGLSFLPDNGIVRGTPSVAGNHALTLHFELEDGTKGTKALKLIVNPDPRSLWKTLEPDEDLPYHKAHQTSDVARLGDKTLVAASKRGRSHANNATFRDDDYAFAELPDGWNCALVADGAGSAKYSRQGSRLTGEFFLEELEQQLQTTTEPTGEQIQDFGEQEEALDQFLKNTLGRAARATHERLDQHAEQCDHTLKDYHTTLAVVLFKKYDDQYFVGTFSVGDCPIVLLDAEQQPTVLNHLDVGEYGGGTRFLTMNSIFYPENYLDRFQIHLIPEWNFNRLFLMTDGIYDPKFEVENRLEQPEAWADFTADLNGENEEGARVDLSPDNPDAGEELLAWMDFWSKGNHDDRTLVVIF